jgi:hypothetical protein
MLSSFLFNDSNLGSPMSQKSNLTFLTEKKSYLTSSTSAKDSIESTVNPFERICNELLQAKFKNLEIPDLKVHLVLQIHLLSNIKEQRSEQSSPMKQKRYSIHPDFSRNNNKEMNDEIVFSYQNPDHRRNMLSKTNHHLKNAKKI